MIVEKLKMPSKNAKNGWTQQTRREGRIRRAKQKEVEGICIRMLAKAYQSDPSSPSGAIPDLGGMGGNGNASTNQGPTVDEVD